MNGGASRYIYNKLVAGHDEIWLLKKTAHLSPADKERLEFLESVFSSKSNLMVMIPFLTIDEIDSDMICHAIQNYQTAWKQFSKVKGTSVPTFHKKDYTFSYTTSNHYSKDSEDGLRDGSIYFIDNNHIRLPKIGRIRCKGSKKLIENLLNSDAEIRIGSVSVEMDNTNYCYISLSLASDKSFHEACNTSSKSYYDYSKSNTVFEG